MLHFAFYQPMKLLLMNQNRVQQKEKFTVLMKPLLTNLKLIQTALIHLSQSVKMKQKIILKQMWRSTIYCFPTVYMMQQTATHFLILDISMILVSIYLIKKLNKILMFILFLCLNFMSLSLVTVSIWDGNSFKKAKMNFFEIGMAVVKKVVSDKELSQNYCFVYYYSSSCSF